MVKTEFYRTREDGVNLYRTYSDENKIIRQIETGEEYDEAIDVENAGYTYEETEKDIETKEVDIETQPSNMEVQYYGKGV